MRTPWFKSHLLRLNLFFHRLNTALQSGLVPLALYTGQWLDVGCDFLNASLLKTDALITVYVKDVQRYDRLVRS